MLITSVQKPVSRGSSTLSILQKVECITSKFTSNIPERFCFYGIELDTVRYSRLQAFCALQRRGGQPLAARAMPAPLLVTDCGALTSWEAECTSNSCQPPEQLPKTTAMSQCCVLL